ncbi:hypothetical protein RR46_13080 [Papilio xuthus]|uniref:Uncharacterized protein n=1 Tax=Papilio xuthus TaxID=66420 RepID=A0A194PS02_PAPXU|nr:hypothetical protein RR46_13080 [Papilio xuthus]
MRQSVAAPCPIDHGGGFCSAVCGRARQPRIHRHVSGNIQFAVLLYRVTFLGGGSSAKMVNHELSRTAPRLVRRRRAANPAYRAPRPALRPPPCSRTTHRSPSTKLDRDLRHLHRHTHRYRTDAAFLSKRCPLSRDLVPSECRCSPRRTAAPPAGKCMPAASGVLVPRLMHRARSV